MFLPLSGGLLGAESVFWLFSVGHVGPPSGHEGVRQSYARSITSATHGAQTSSAVTSSAVTLAHRSCCS